MPRMTGQSIPTVDGLTALLAAVISVLPLFMLLNIHTVESYRSVWLRFDLLRRWIERRISVTPGLALTAGLLAGILSARLALFVGELTALGFT